MDQVDQGIRSILKIPAIYKAFQFLVGDTKFQKQYVREFLCPFKGMRILDVGCGPAQILSLLPQDIEYHGYDLSPVYIDYAKKKYGDRGRFYCEHVSDVHLENSEKYDVVLANGLLHHLNDGDASNFFKLAKKALKDEKSFLLTYDPAYLINQNFFAHFLVKNDRGQHVRFPKKYESLAKPHFKEVKTTVLNDSYYVPYSLAVLKCSIPQEGAL